MRRRNMYINDPQRQFIYLFALRHYDVEQKPKKKKMWDICFSRFFSFFFLIKLILIDKMKGKLDRKQYNEENILFNGIRCYVGNVGNGMPKPVVRLHVNIFIVFEKFRKFSFIYFNVWEIPSSFWWFVHLIMSFEFIHSFFSSKYCCKQND